MRLGKDGALARALAFLLSEAPNSPDGRLDFAGGAYAETRRYAPTPRERRFYEGHAKYVDVQCVLEGEEFILVRPAAGLRVKEDLLADRDVVFYHDPDDGEEIPYLMRPGSFLYLRPADAHKTECLAGSATVRKTVYKIPVSPASSTPGR